MDNLSVEQYNNVFNIHSISSDYSNIKSIISICTSQNTQASLIFQIQK